MKGWGNLNGEEFIANRAFFSSFSQNIYPWSSFDTSIDSNFTQPSQIETLQDVQPGCSLDSSIDSNASTIVPTLKVLNGINGII